MCHSSTSLQLALIMISINHDFMIFNHDFTRTHIDEAGVVTLLQVVQNTGLIEVSQRGHVLNLLELWRVHLVSVIDVHGDLLKSGSKI